MKDNLFKRIVMRNYKNNLEEVFSQKNFSEEVKNTLLGMFYKIENGYKDYNTIKRDTFDKKEYIQKITEIINKECENIEFITKNNKKQEKVDREAKEIVCWPIENRILYSLAKIHKRNIVVKYIDESIEKAFSFLLNTGNNINIVEPLRDFNGFSWNIIVQDIEELNYNTLYQNIIYLLGNEFVDKWVNNYEPLVDYFELFQEKIEKKYDEEIKEKIVTNLIIISIKLKAIYDEEFEKEVVQKRQELIEENVKLENREAYLQELVDIKKQKEKEICELDKLLNNEENLVEEYNRRNSNLPLQEKIFSVRILKNILNEERQTTVEVINRCNNLMKPNIFLNRKNEIEQKLKYFEPIENFDPKVNLINIQKEIIKCIYIDIKKIKDKKSLIEMIYKYRYYNLLPVSTRQRICDIKTLRSGLDRLTEILIKKAIDMKVLIKISDDEIINLNIIEHLLLSKIICLEDIDIKFIYEKDGVYLVTFDEQIEENKVKLEDISKKDIKVKFNKKVKLFI